MKLLINLNLSNSKSLYSKEYSFDRLYDLLVLHMYSLTDYFNLIPIEYKTGTKQERVLRKAIKKHLGVTMFSEDNIVNYNIDMKTRLISNDIKLLDVLGKEYIIKHIGKNPTVAEVKIFAKEHKLQSVLAVLEFFVNNNGIETLPFVFSIYQEKKSESKVK